MDELFIALRVLAALGLVVGTIWAVRKTILKRQGSGGGRPQAVTVVGRQAIGAKASVVVVDVEGRRLVLGVTEQSVGVLSSDKTPTASFSDAMAEAEADAELSPQPSTLVPGSILDPKTWKRFGAAVRTGVPK